MCFLSLKKKKKHFFFHVFYCLRVRKLKQSGCAATSSNDVSEEMLFFFSSSLILKLIIHHLLISKYKFLALTWTEKEDLSELVFFFFFLSTSGNSCRGLTWWSWKMKLRQVGIQKPKKKRKINPKGLPSNFNTSLISYLSFSKRRKEKKDDGFHSQCRSNRTMMSYYLYWQQLKRNLFIIKEKKKIGTHTTIYQPKATPKLGNFF